MDNRLGSTALTLVTLCIGGGIISTAFSQGIGESVGAFIFGIVIGGFCVFAGIVFLFLLCIPSWKNKKHTLKDEVNSLVKPDQKGAADVDATDNLITSFRESFYNFFSTSNIIQNSNIQNTSTQLYWHILYLQKLRMNKNKVAMKFEAERKSYNNISIEKQKYFDGKYEITDVKERIFAKRTYNCGSKFSYIKKDTEIANYCVLNARTVSYKDVVCPNCGNTTTRENLLDGCDFCDTKFSVEDLGSRISNFAMRKDYEVEYAKYKDNRKFFTRRAFIIGAVPAFIISVVMMIFVSLEQKEGLVMSIVATLIGSGFVALAMGFFTAIGFSVFIFPLLQIKHYINYTIKDTFAKIKVHNSLNNDIVKKIQEMDSLFSLENFISNIINKIATIHYADNKEQISVFSEADLTDYFPGYSDIVDMEVSDFVLEDFAFDSNAFRVTMTVYLNLLRVSKNKFYNTKEKLSMLVAKNAECKTKAICEPSVLRCKGCNSAISLLDGGKCNYCGTKINMKNYDWIIEDYKVLKR